MMVEQLADSKLFVSLCRDRRGHYPFVFISFISRKAEEFGAKSLAKSYGVRQYEVFQEPYNDFGCGPRIPSPYRRGS